MKDIDSIESAVELEQRALAISKENNVMVLFSKRHKLYIEVSFYNQLIMIGGNSGIGKTYFMKGLLTALRNYRFDIANIDTKRIHVEIDPLRLKGDIGTEDILFIDRGDILTPEQTALLTRFISSGKLVVLFARAITGIKTQIPVYGDTFKVRNIEGIECFVINDREYR